MASIVDRAVSALTYFTFGIFGIIWLIYVNVAKKEMTAFTMFNVFQSCCITVILAVIGYAFGIILQIVSVIPILGPMLKNFNLFFNGTPIYMGYSISGLIIAILIGYMTVVSLIGKKPFVPFISPIIQANIRG